MTHAERFRTAITGGIPDYVPTFELEFQLTEELCGKRFVREDDLKGLSPEEVEAKLRENAEIHLEVYRLLDHDAICIHYLSEEHLIRTAQLIKELSGNEFFLMCHGDGTYAIPDGDGMARLSYAIADDPEAVEAEAERMCVEAIERNRRYLAGGFDGFILCSDYCFNAGPFLSPKMFARFVAPYLARIIADIKEHGGIAIKHTDGNIMPILDQLVAAKPHALHSIDPMAGVDIREVKELTRGKVALCGNVHCAAMQTGTEEDVIASAEYCLKYAKPGGGYVYCTSNVPFKGLPLDRYLLVLDVWKKHRAY